MRAIAIRENMVWSESRQRSYRAGFWFALLFFFLLSIHLPASWKIYPDRFVVPFDAYIRSGMEWLTGDTPQVPGFPPFVTLTRGVAAALNAVLDFLKALMANGFGDDDNRGALPAIPWFAIIGLFTLSGWRLGGRGLALAALLGLGFIAVTGNWTPAMETLASVIVSAVLAAALGLALGIVAYSSRTFERIQSPILDVMQTMPVFAYLVPVLLLLGFGPAAATTATIIYAMPPMIRNTLHGLRRVPSEISEFGLIAGCTWPQLIRRVLVPSAREIIMVGINQVIMMSLNMVIIASMIGAGGLGYQVLTSLRRLQIGVGLEAGLAIVALAVILDRQSQALAHRKQVRLQHARNRIAAVASIVVVLVAWSGSWKGLWSSSYPSDDVFNATAVLDTFTRWITDTFSDTLDQLKTYLLVWVMLPVRTFFQGLPWFTLPVCAGCAGLLLDGPRLGLLCFGLLTVIFAAGLQQPTLTTVYLCALGTAVSLVIGVPLGILAGKRDWAHRGLNVICDTLQTLPSFVYLIPVIMLFRVGDFSAIVAIVAFAVAPAIRYTDLGIRRTPPQIIESCLIAGCTPLQLLWRVELPLAVPEILLGVSQTVMMALSMLVITALVGTRDLGQETFIALTHADVGQGAVAGLAIAFIAIVTDRLISAWSQSRLETLGLKH